jgi:predicted nuclease of predicted toxin-antitoxin system
VRFVLDHNVDAAVAAVLRREGHEAWTAGRAGLSRVSDDELTAYADDRNAALLTHDVEFSERRRKNVIGKHVWIQRITPAGNASAHDAAADHSPANARLRRRRHGRLPTWSSTRSAVTTEPCCYRPVLATPG